MATTGDVQITINDGGAGAVVVPGSTVQIVIGCSSAGSVAQVVATQNPNTLISSYGYGPLVEAAALACLAGGTVIAMKATSNAAGTSTAVTFTGSGTSVITLSVGAAFDDYQVRFLVVNGGTIGTTGITFQLSFDAGRNFGPVISLGTAVTYAIPNTGLTLAFAAGTLVTNDKAQFSCTAPAWNTAGVQACLVALQASPYALAGWGSMHLVGVSNGAAATTIDGFMTTMQIGYIFSRILLAARDAIIPVAWGGAGETEATWAAAIALDFSAVSAKRVCANAGHYNMPSAFPGSVYGAPRFRRSLAWAHACRAVQIPPQRHSGRVRDGALANVVVDPTNDPNDGFIYHDERNNPTLNVARFTSARTRVGKQGYFITNPNTMAPTGSVFALLPLGNVMDIACSIIHQVGQDIINSDVRVNPNGTIFENEARSIEAALLGAINVNMTNQAMISSATVTVDRSVNVLSTSTIKVTVSIVARGYVLEEDVIVGFANPFAQAS